MDRQRVHIIGEAGTNHGGSLETGRRLIEVAARSGCDSVKFQIIIPEELYVPALWQDNVRIENPVVAARRRGMLSETAIRDLASFASEQGIPLSASVFGADSLRLLEDLRPPYVKIASCDLDNHLLLEQAAASGLPVIVSTGMSDLGDIESAVRVLDRAGASEPVLLHCVSIYPARLESMNLSFIDTLRTAFGLPVGLSDHTESSLAAAIAVAKGATWIEKHFTLDRAAEGFDHAYAMEPDMLSAFVADVRAAESAVSRPPCKLTEAELETRKRARRALYAAHDLPRGHILTAQDILLVRPTGPLAADRYHEVCGCRLRSDVQRFQPLDWSLLEP